MSDNHGNTPAAWTAVVVALLGFTVGAVGLMLNPVNKNVFWVGIVLAVGAIGVYAVMARLGFDEASR